MLGKLSELKPGESGFVEKIIGEGAFRRRLIDMGITPETKITVVRLAPFGDPIQITIRGYELSIRKSDAEQIIIFNKNKVGSDNR